LDEQRFRLETFLSIDSDVTAIECALIASLIAVFIIVAIELFGASSSTMFNGVGAALK
jgi:Flp pilus assembly pilin Flp